jgi:DegV family protein with EDD domain
MPRVAVVTDSTADLPPDIASSLGITVVPLNLHFGTETYRDGIDLSADEFYRRLSTTSVMPTTSQPSIGTFEQTFEGLARDHDGIISLHISSKLSGTYNSAAVACQAVKESCPIEVIDSGLASMSLGFVAIAAARAAQAGQSLTEIHQLVTRRIPNVGLLFMVETMEFLRRGGRIGRAQALIGGILSIKPLLTLEDGIVCPVEKVRTRSRATERLVEYVERNPRLEGLAIMHSTTPDDVDSLVTRFEPMIARENIIIGKYGPVLGAHLGPGALGIMVDRGADD